jgi:hypothetical protein
MEFDNIRTAHLKTYEIFVTHWQSPNPVELELFYEYLLFTSFKLSKLNIKELQGYWNKLIDYTPTKKYKKLINEHRVNRFNYYERYGNVYNLDFIKEQVMWVGKETYLNLPLGRGAYKTEKAYKAALELHDYLVNVTLAVYTMVEGKDTLISRLAHDELSREEFKFFGSCMKVHKEHNIILKPAFGLKRAFNWYTSLGDD